MRNSKFLRELENDNVDSEIVSEELRCLQADEQPRSSYASGVIITLGDTLRKLFHESRAAIVLNVLIRC